MIILLFYAFCSSASSFTLYFPPSLVVTNIETLLLPILREIAVNTQSKSYLVHSSFTKPRQPTTKKKANKLSL